MNEKVVAVQVDRPVLGEIIYPAGHSWDFSWGAGHAPILLILDGTGQIVGAHCDWLSVHMTDAPEGVSAA